MLLAVTPFQMLAKAKKCYVPTSLRCKTSEFPEKSNPEECGNPLSVNLTENPEKFASFIPDATRAQ
jgi:hypothetical protein